MGWSKTPGPDSPQQLRGRTAEYGSCSVQAAEHERGGHGKPVLRVKEVVAEPSPARLQRPVRPGGHGAPRPPPRGRARERAGATCPRRPRRPAGLWCLHLSPAPPWAPTDHPAEARQLVAGRPQSTAWVRGAAWPRALGHHAGLRGLGRGGPAPGRVLHTWPGRGASLQIPNPGFGESGFEGGAGGSCFPALLGITPLANRHPRDRWRRRRESHGAWPHSDWLLGSARGRGRVVSP